MEDVQAISSLGLPLNGIAPQFSGSADIVAPAADKNATIVGTTPAYFALQDLRTTSGSLFDEGQSRAGAPVVVLGATLAKDLFGNGTAVGQTVRVKDQTLRVIGVLAAKGGGGLGSADDQLFAPINFVQQRLFGARTPDGNSYRVANILLSARNGDDINAIQDRIAVLLRERHHLKADGSDDDFSVIESGVLAEHAEQHHLHPHRLPGRDRRHLPAGGRHRHHEHHAGQRHRADEGDRPAQGRRRAGTGHPAAVHRRGAGDQRDGRRHRAAIGDADRRPRDAQRRR